MSAKRTSLPDGTSTASTGIPAMSAGPSGQSKPAGLSSFLTGHTASRFPVEAHDPNLRFARFQRKAAASAPAAREHARGRHFG